jgi:hypothetical protein
MRVVDVSVIRAACEFDRHEKADGPSPLSLGDVGLIPLPAPRFC